MNKADGVASADGLDSSLLLAEWYRVILDESHEVRKWNPKAVGKQVQAVMALQKVHGLCLSGTPMQVRIIRASIFSNWLDSRLSLECPLRSISTAAIFGALL